MERKRPHNTGIIGLILVVAGVFLIARNFNIFPYYLEGVLFSWQTLLIAIGLIILANGKNRTTGFILITVGGVFMLPEIFDWGFHSRRLFWPVVFIIIGMFVLFRNRIEGESSAHGKGISADTGGDYIDEVCIFSGCERRIGADNFKGGKITTIFGGAEINLLSSKLAPGKQYIEVNAIFGGTTFIVPPDWTVRIEVTAIFGGFADKRALPAETMLDTGKELVIKGTVIFGGGEIKNYK